MCAVIRAPMTRHAREGKSVSMGEGSHSSHRTQPRTQWRTNQKLKSPGDEGKPMQEEQVGPAAEIFDAGEPPHQRQVNSLIPEQHPMVLVLPPV